MTCNGKINFNEIKNYHHFKNKKEPIREKDIHGQKISDIWRRIFGHSKFTSKTSFFDLGGNSVMCMVLLSEINQQLNVHITCLLYTSDAADDP